MLWFKPEADGTLFSSSQLTITNEQLPITNNEWHHYVLAVSRTYNTASVFVDGQLIRSESADAVGALSGNMYLGGNGFKGHIDEFVLFEQALPKPLIELYEDNALTGDEMGLMAYLPFEEQYTNPNGIIEQRFSVNDQRIFKDANGNVINKVVPLVLGDGLSVMGDGTLNAPVKSNGVLNKLYFNWAFNNDELMINILNRDYEVNKQSIYVTVRDVEDLNGNPMASPVTWTAFVDRNALKWSEKQLSVTLEDGAEDDWKTEVRIVNQSGKRHQYTIESLPAWLSVNQTYGAIDPMDEQRVKLTFNHQIAVGEYSDLIYLTDENGLSEPLRIEYMVEAIAPYDDIDKAKYPLNMSVCGQVKIDNVIDFDDRDIVFALYRNECIGTATVDVDELSNSSKLFMTVYGNETMKNKQVNFVLWQASTGKTFNLSTSLNGQPLTIKFAEGAIYGCGNSDPVLFVTNGSEVQNIVLNPGWNWTSFNIDVQQNATGVINNVMTAAEPWSEGDLMKNPYTRNFCVYSDSLGCFTGSLYHFYYIWMHMIYSKNGNTMRVYGNTLPEDSMHITLKGDGAWNAFPCLLKEATSVTEALADYYNYATPGDLLKAHDRFAVFSSDKRWEGDLKAIHPGEGYLFRRMGQGAVTVNFFNKQQSNAPEKINHQSPVTNDHWRSHAATNMTMIAKVEGVPVTGYGLRAYIGDELVGVATPITLNPSSVTEGETLYFLTICSDVGSELRFETEDGTPLTPMSNNQSPITIGYVPDAHHGSLKAPVLLAPVTGNPSPVTPHPYKIIENQRVIIIRGGERYDVTGKKIE
jgi:hypothetical protein